MLKRTVLLLILCLPAFPQNPNIATFPSQLLTDEVSTVAKDRSVSVLDASIDADDLTLTVDTGHGSRFVQFEIITIEDEQMMVCSVAGDTLTICPGTRGFSWTTAVSHSNGADVSGNYVEWIVNQLNAEMKAVQTLLGINGAGVLRTNVDSTTAAETLTTFQPGVVKPGFRVGCGPLPSTPGTGGVLHCNSADTNSPYWYDGTIWKSLSEGVTGIANRGFERTGTNFSIDQAVHGYDHGNLIVTVYDFDTENEIDTAVHVDRTAPYAISLVGNLPNSRHMWVTIAGWGGPSGTGDVTGASGLTNNNSLVKVGATDGGLVEAGFADVVAEWTACASGYLKFDGTCDTPAGGGLSDGDKGDVTVSSSGAVWNIDAGVVGDTEIATGVDAAKIADGSVSSAEYQHISTVTSNVQTQLNGKAAAGANTDITSITGTAALATALAANPTDCSSNQFANAIAANGNLGCAALVDADVPDTITASNYQPLDAELTALAGYTVPAAGTAGTAPTNAGTATALARNDHQHLVPWKIGAQWQATPSTGLDTTHLPIDPACGGSISVDTIVISANTKGTAFTFNVQRFTAALVSVGNLFSSTQTYNTAGNNLQSFTTNQNNTGVTQSDILILNVVTITGTNNFTVLAAGRCKNL